jgi:hypothetical protein
LVEVDMQTPTRSKILSWLTALILILSVIPLMVPKRLSNAIYVPKNYLLGVLVITGIVVWAWSKAKRSKNVSWWVVIFGISVSIFSYFIPPALVFIAANGSGSDFSATFGWFTNNNVLIEQIESYLVIAVSFELIIFPAILHERVAWRGAPAAKKKVVLAWLAVTASLSTALYAILLHFHRGPLHRIPLGQLSAAMLFVVVLLLPIYRSVATAFSERGATGTFNPSDFWKRQIEAAQMLYGTFREVSSTNSPDSRDASVVRAPLGDEQASTTETINQCPQDRQSRDCQ